MRSLTRSNQAMQALLFSSIVLAGCDNTAPQRITSPSALREIAFNELDALAAAGPARARITVTPGGLIADEVRVNHRDLAAPEQITSLVTAAEATESGGTITLALNGMEFPIDASIRYELKGIGGGNPQGSLTVEQFVAAIQVELARGHTPEVVMTRAATPQDPGDPTFAAQVIVLQRGTPSDAYPVIEMNIGDENVRDNTSTQPDGWIQLLGVQFEVFSSAGITRIMATS